MSFIYNQKIIFHLEKEKNENPSELIFITPSNSNKDPLSHKPCLVACHHTKARFPSAMATHLMGTTEYQSESYGPSYISGGYTHLGFGALCWVNGLGLVKLRFHVTFGDAVTQ